MKILGKDLIFISQINRDGKGVTLVDDELIKGHIIDNDEFKVKRLSMSHDTYIASGFNSYVVKIKNK